MKKRGFTLIELLAVIVILAIIALIATPIVMNVIENAKKGAAERSAENYLHAVEIAIMEAKMDGTLEDGIYTINEDGSIQYKNNKINVDISTNKVTSGFVTIANGEVTDSTINTEETTLIYDENGKKEIGVWDGKTEAVTKSEDGYHITNAEQLAWLSEQVSNGNTFAEDTIYLDADIDLNNIEWTPIGNANYKFKGTFEGNNHTIKNLSINKIIENNDANKRLGLFGYIANARINDLNISNCKILGYSNSSCLSGRSDNSEISNINIYNANVKGYKNLGILVGYNNITDLSNINVFNSNLEGQLEYIGGIIGNSVDCLTYNNLNVYNTTVKSSSQYIGGVIGRAADQSTTNMLAISNVYSNAIVDNSASTEGLSSTGGIIGAVLQNSVLDNLISEATVIGEIDIGGIIGHLEANVTLKNSLSSAIVQGTDKIGGVVGVDSSPESSLVNIKSSAKVTCTSEAAGGIVGIVSGAKQTYTDLYSSATIIGNNRVGGLIGIKFGNSDQLTIENGYSSATITGKTRVGSIIGSIEPNQVVANLVYSNLNSTATITREDTAYNEFFGYVDSTSNIKEK